ncbi:MULTISPECIES: HAD family hydrolase [Streptomyces]|uniref:Hydrolase n=1 Tax=Streptomyces nigrescens TaxID=1920 RepID=A0A640TDT5_STRNI|nr:MULTISPECIES: HAD family hydrolase [Streptomyces]WAT96482.1 HAD family hydrolase [Streptomyces libani subsp. libani]WDT57768.1 HAD family hydrolase [Streptomyces sp. G7(2002)]GFE21849.1 hydrolase [Streptomyces libani subsp. libani]GGV89365.1 hydrolase [Streptomyces libani subsp. libani]
MPLRAVLWDLDDTLFDYTGSDRAGVLRHLRTEGILDAYGGEEVALERWRTAMETEFARFLAGEVGFLDHRRGRTRTFLGTPLSDPEADAWFGRYLAHYEASWALFPDSAPALAALAPLVRQAVLSNAATANQERKLAALGIRTHFEAVFCADGLGHAKPAEEAFKGACKALGLTPDEVLHIGDKLDIDALGARDAGLTAVWLDRAGTGEDPPAGVRRIASLAELPELLHGVIGFGAPSTIR